MTWSEDETTAPSDPFAIRLPCRDHTQADLSLASSSGLEDLAAQPSNDRHRFQRLRPHAKGGLGEVYVAHD